MQTAITERHIATLWDAEIVPALTDYIRVPAKSPHFDPAWEANGHLDRVTRDALAWVQRQPVRGLVAEIVRLPGRTPVLFFEVPASSADNAARTVLIYGHLDKQPEMTGWREGFGAWLPRFEDGRLYGRGGADDGYAVYAAIAALASLQAQGAPHARCVGLIETCEESGSFDLPAYLEALAPRLGAVGFVVGLDSGCGDYERLWVTTSLRGLAAGTLGVEVLTEGVHSGHASGIVPSSFRIARKVLERIDDAATGRVLPAEFHAPIPEERERQAYETAAILGDLVIDEYPFAGGTQPMTHDHVEALLNRSWRPALSVTGADGLPSIASAGNVLRPRTALKLSLRLPPPLDGAKATADLKRILESDPPCSAHGHIHAGSGRHRMACAADEPVARARTAGCIAGVLWPSRRPQSARAAPFRSWQCSAVGFRQAQFLITGVLGPQSNAHGPNEFLHVPYAKRLTACVARVIEAHAQSAAR